MKLRYLLLLFCDFQQKSLKYLLCGVLICDANIEKLGERGAKVYRVAPELVTFTDWRLACETKK